LFIQVASGGLDPGIQGPRLVKMCVRCIKCFLAYFTGNKEDLDTSEDEEGEDDEEGGGRYLTIRRIRYLLFGPPGSGSVIIFTGVPDP
jgi:hypothetical protein